MIKITFVRRRATAIENGGLPEAAQSCKMVDDQ
jgi:hypothetical protein